jgi:hypothetical protein
LRRLIALLGLLTCLIGTSSATAATTTSFSASFFETFGRATAHSCPPDVFLCGTGTVSGFGEATETVVLTSFDFESAAATGCSPTTLTRTITLADGSTLVTEETGTVCFPGSSFGTSGSFVSFGNPASFEGTYRIVSGTGVFRGARGSGTSTFKNAGDAGHASLSGTITLR